jgi:hypothetical protein
LRRLANIARATFALGPKILPWGSSDLGPSRNLLSRELFVPLHPIIRDVIVLDGWALAFLVKDLINRRLCLTDFHTQAEYQRLRSVNVWHRFLDLTI